jgi:hypothetical protein
MVNPFDDRHPILGQPVDDSEMPQGSRSIERSAEQVAEQLPELRQRTPGPEVDGLHVPGDVEVRIIGPQGWSAREHGRHHSAPEFGHGTQPSLEVPPEVVEAQATVPIPQGRALEEPHAAEMHGRPVALDMEERRFER